MDSGVDRASASWTKTAIVYAIIAGPAAAVDKGADRALASWTKTAMVYAIIAGPAAAADKGADRALASWTKTAMVYAIIARPAAAADKDGDRETGDEHMRSEQEVNRAIEQYADMVRRLCVIHLNCQADAEDIFQTVFLKYALSSVKFQDGEHEKAWLIRVTINACRDLLKSFFHSRTLSLDELAEQAAEMPEDHREVLDAVLALPQKYREVIYLHFYEGYTAPEIGRILRKNVNTIYTLMARAKGELRVKLGGDDDG